MDRSLKREAATQPFMPGKLRHDSLPGLGCPQLWPLNWRRPGRIQDWSADSPVRAFVPSDKIRADKAVRAPVSVLLESALGGGGGGDKIVTFRKE